MKTDSNTFCAQSVFIFLKGGSFFSLTAVVSLIFSSCSFLVLDYRSILKWFTVFIHSNWIYRFILNYICYIILYFVFSDESFVSRRKMKLHTCCPPTQESNPESGSVTENQSYTAYTDLQNSSVVSEGSVDNSISHIISNSLVNSSHIINNSLVNSLGQVTHFLTDQGLNNMSTLPSHLISEQGRSDLLPATNDLIPASKLNSDTVVQLADTGNTSSEAKLSEDQILSAAPKKESEAAEVYQDGMLLERVPEQSSHQTSYPQNDVLSQAFAVMGEDLMQDCVNLNTCSVLEAKPGVSIGPDATVYTLVRLEGQDQQQALISIPTVSESGTEENVTLQINLTDDCSEVYIIES